MAVCFSSAEPVHLFVRLKYSVFTILLKILNHLFPIIEVTIEKYNYPSSLVYSSTFSTQYFNYSDLIMSKRINFHILLVTCPKKDKITSKDYQISTQKTSRNLHEFITQKKVEL